MVVPPQPPTLHPSNGDQVVAQAGAASNGGLRATVERGQVPGGRAYSRTLRADTAGPPAASACKVRL